MRKSQCRLGSLHRPQVVWQSSSHSCSVAGAPFPFALAICICFFYATFPALTDETKAAEFRYEEPRLFTGQIYEKGSDNKHLLLKFKRQSTRFGNTVNALREYCRLNLNNKCFLSEPFS